MSESILVRLDTLPGTPPADLQSLVLPIVQSSEPFLDLSEPPRVKGDLTPPDGYFWALNQIAAAMGHQGPGWIAWEDDERCIYFLCFPHGIRYALLDTLPQTKKHSMGEQTLVVPGIGALWTYDPLDRDSREVPTACRRVVRFLLEQRVWELPRYKVDYVLEAQWVEVPRG